MSIFMNDKPSNRPPLSFRQKLVVAAIDVAMLVELCVAMYMANQNPDEFTPVFVKTFFTQLLPTLAAGFVALRLLKPRQTAA